MKTFWKIKNISDRQIKVAVAISSTQAPGLILQPGQFCISQGQMTSPVDKQQKSGFITIEKDFVNVQDLELAKAYNSTILDKIKENTKNYAK